MLVAETTDRVDMAVVSSLATPVPLILFVDKEEHLVWMAYSGRWVVHLLSVSVHSHASVIHRHLSFHDEAIVLDSGLVLWLAIV